MIRDQDGSSPHYPPAMPTPRTLLGEAVGIEDLSPQVLRRTFATDMVRAGADLVLVSELVGHARTDTTKAYTRSTAEDRERAVNLLHTDR